MTGTKKKYAQKMKVKVAIEAIKGQKTMAEISSEYGVHGTQINNWKKQALAIIPDAFSSGKAKADKNQQDLIDELYKQIGQLKVEKDWLKKKSDELGL